MKLALKLPIPAFVNRFEKLFNKTAKWAVMDRYAELRELLLSLETDFKKFYEDGNKAAGTRVRKGLQDLKELSQEVRAEVQEVKHSEAKQ